MRSSLAEQWDEQHGRSVDHHVIEDGKFVPINRPCDWCGDRVEKGFIHSECLAKETEVMLDILY